MVVPGLAGHLDRHKQTKYSCHRTGHYRRHLAIPLYQLGQCRDTEPDPDTERIERTCIGIVSFTRLVRSLVQIKHNGDTRHKEEEEGDPEALDTTLSGISLIQQPEDTEQKRQHIVDIVSFIIGNIRRHIILRADKYLVDRLDTGDPVTVQHLTIPLDIILTSGEVPHEVAPVHEIELVSEEITQVFGKRRFHHGYVFTATVKLHRFSLELRPFLISSHMSIDVAVHTWEKHTQLVHILIIDIVT